MTKASQADQDLIRAIAELLNEQDLAEVEIEREEFRIRVTRAYASNQVVQAVAPAAAPAPAAAAISTSAIIAGTPKDDLASNPGSLLSPMVGTAYLSAEPGSAPFVEIGSTVSEGQTLLIIEAMKTMNQIPAHKSGKISQILINDAQPVEYGEPLVVIE